MASAGYEHVTKRFPGGETAVNDLCLDVKDGEFMVVLGPSGCGKSTVLRLLAGLEDVTEGVIRIGDTVVNHVRPRNRHVAMVFETSGRYPHMSVLDQLSVGKCLRRL